MQNAANGRVWFISREGQQYGPVSDIEMAKLLELGHLSPVDYVWCEGMGNWSEARTVPELVALRPAPLPPPPPPPPPRAPGYEPPSTWQQQSPQSTSQPQAQASPLYGAGPRPASPGDAPYASGSAAYAPAPTAGTGANAVARHHAAGATPHADGGAGTTVALPRADDTTITMIAYVLLLILPLIGVIIAFVNRSSAPEWLATHYRWQIRTFFLGLVYALVGAILSLVAIGFLVVLFTVVWWIVRTVKGIMALNRREAIANPASWLW